MLDKSKWLVDSGKRWRLKINESKAKGKAIGPFHDWKVILLVDPSRKMGFTRVLMAGGAEVLTLSEFDDISGKEVKYIWGIIVKLMGVFSRLRIVLQNMRILQQGRKLRGI